MVAAPTSPIAPPRESGAMVKNGTDELTTPAPVVDWALEISTIESSIISKRVKSAFQIRRKLGYHFGNPPYGYNIYNTVDIKSGIKLRELIENLQEQNIINFVNKLYYGCNIKEIYNCFYKIKPDYSFKLIDIKNNELTIVKYGNIITKDIKMLLEENDITYRSKPWKLSYILKIIKNNRQNKIK